MATQVDPATEFSPESLRTTRRAIAWGLLWGAGMLAILTLWLANKDDPPVFVLLPVLLLAVAAAAGVVLLLRAPAPAGAAPEQVQQALLKQRRVTATGLFIGAGVLVLLGLLLSVQQGLSAFPEASSMVVFALIAAGAAASQLSRPGTTHWRDQLLEAVGRVLSTPVTGLALMGVAVLLFVLLKWQRGEWTITPEIVGLLCFGIACLLVSLILTPEITGRSQAQAWRLQVLVGGGALGLTIALTMVFRVKAWWGEIFPATEAAAQSPGLWRLWLCLYIELFGLAILFGSLLLARADVRQSATMRRLLYGYNAFLSGLMVLAILFVLNVVVAITYPLNFEWSKTQGLRDLADSSKALLESLRDQVRLYVLLSPYNHGYTEVHALLDNVQGYSRRVQVDYVSPDKEGSRYQSLARKYPVVEREQQVLGTSAEDRGRGVLIVYGPDVGEKGRHAFVPLRDIIEDKREGERMKVLFKGEDAIMSQIKILAEGEIKPKLYFTQGHGEMRLQDALPPGVKFRDPRLHDPRGGLGTLLERLKKDNYDVRGLFWGAPPEQAFPGFDLMAFSKKNAKTRDEVPEDAKVLLLAGPRVPFSKEILEALQRYMDRGGKLVVLSNYVIAEDEALIDTGIETFLKKFGVEMGKDWPMRAPVNPRDDDEVLMVVANTPPNSRNKVAASFRKSRFALSDALGTREWVLARTVRPSTGPGEFKAEPLLHLEEERNEGPVWAETELNVLKAPLRYVRGLEINGQLESKKSREPVPLAVTVTDREQKPRLVVFGDARFAANQFVRSPAPYYDFFTSSIEWLAERPGNIGIRPKESGSYTVDTKELNRDRLVWLPLALLLLAMGGLGAGIWVVRRR